MYAGGGGGGGGGGMYEEAVSGSNSRRCKSNASNLSKIHPDPRYTKSSMADERFP